MVMKYFKLPVFNGVFNYYILTFSSFVIQGDFITVFCTVGLCFCLIVLFSHQSQSSSHFSTMFFRIPFSSFCFCPSPPREILWIFIF